MTKPAWLSENQAGFKRFLPECVENRSKSPGTMPTE